MLATAVEASSRVNRGNFYSPAAYSTVRDTLASYKQPGSSRGPPTRPWRSLYCSQTRLRQNN